MSCEWVVVDGVDSERVEDVLRPEEEPLLEELLDMLEDETTRKQVEDVRAYASWADLVKTTGPFTPSPRARPEPETPPPRAPRERSESPSRDNDEKVWATDKYSKKSRHQSFGHTLCAKRTMVGMKATHVVVPKQSSVTTELDAMLPSPDESSPGRTVGCLVPLQGELQYAGAEAVAEALGGKVVTSKHGACYNRQRSARLEAVLAGYLVTEIDVPASDGRTKRYAVCEPQRSTGFVKHPKCSAAAGRASGFFKAGRPGLLLQEVKKERAWREEIRFGMEAGLVEA